MGILLDANYIFVKILYLSILKMQTEYIFAMQLILDSLQINV